MRQLNDLKYVQLDKRIHLPDKPGIYVVTHGEPKRSVLYVGQAKSLNTRWNSGGNRKHKILRKIQGYRDVRIYFQICHEGELNRLENAAFDTFRPSLNKIRPPADRISSIRGHRVRVTRRRRKSELTRWIARQIGEFDLLTWVIIIGLIIVLISWR